MASTIIKRAYLFNFILSLFSTYLHLVEVYLYCSVYYIKPIHLYTKHVEIDNQISLWKSESVTLNYQNKKTFKIFMNQWLLGDESWGGMWGKDYKGM